MTLASFFSRADWFEPFLVENPKDRFSLDKAQFKECVGGFCLVLSVLSPVLSGTTFSSYQIAQHD